MAKRNSAWDFIPIGAAAPIDTRPVLPTEKPDTEFNYIALENIESGTGRLLNLKPVKGATIRSNKFVFDASHVLLGKLRPYLNKVVVPNRAGICSTDIVPLLPRADILCREWLAACLRSPEFIEYSRAKMDGAKMPRLRTPDLESFEIPVPPLSEQRRLVARIEALASRLEQARQARKSAIVEAGNAQAALVNSVFAERSGAWDEATVKELCGQPQYGYTESASHKGVGPRFLRITDIQNGEVDWDNVPFCRCDKPAKYQLADGDIVFARTGATTGKSYLVRNPPNAVFASYLIRIRPGERVLPEYMWWYFQSSGYWHSVFSGIDDGNRPNMNGSKLAALLIPFPKSKDAQRSIVSRLDALAAKQAELRRLQTETEAELAAFTPALLAKAFRGEL